MLLLLSATFVGARRKIEPKIYFQIRILCASCICMSLTMYVACFLLAFEPQLGMSCMFSGALVIDTYCMQRVLYRMSFQ